MTLTNEQIQQILDGAPEGATHYAADDGKDGAYVMSNSSGFHNWYPEDGWEWEYRDEWFKVTNSLSDLREIITLRQEVERLKAQQSEVAARAVAESCNQSCSVIANIEQEGVVNSRDGIYCDIWLSSSDLMKYANQIREQGDEL